MSKEINIYFKKHKRNKARLLKRGKLSGLPGDRWPKILCWLFSKCQPGDSTGQYHHTKLSKTIESNEASEMINLHRVWRGSKSDAKANKL